jgi:sec-independent protein translocase protein TatC
MLSMGAYLTLATRLLIAFGLVFELPIVIFFLARMGVVDHVWLAKNRKYALLVAFIVGATLTPPDVISQASIAIPFIILYEVGIVIARLFGKKKEADETLDDEVATEAD